jgi:hypothetical protein
MKISHFSRALRVAGVLSTLSIAGAIAPRALADVDLRINLGAPPPPRHERYSERDRPGADYVWVEGYWVGNGGRYEWVPGHWDRPPHRGAVWVSPRWDNQGRDRVFVKGYWRDNDRDRGRDRDREHEEHEHDNR